MHGTSPLHSSAEGPKSKEKAAIQPDLAEYILRNPDGIFTEYQKTIKALSSKSNFTARDVSIIYRREIGDKKSPEFIFNQACVSWIITNYQGSIGSPAELVSLVEALSGMSSADLSNESSAEVTADIAEETSQQVQAQLPTNSKEEDDNDISEWLVDQSNRHDN